MKSQNRICTSRTRVCSIRLHILKTCLFTLLRPSQGFGGTGEKGIYFGGTVEQRPNVEGTGEQRQYWGTGI